MRYIGVLAQCLKARSDFGNLEYVADIKNDEEYLILSDIIGQACILRITGYNDEMILQTIAQIICGITPSNMILDKAEMMRIARLR